MTYTVYVKEIYFHFSQLTLLLTYSFCCYSFVQVCRFKLLRSHMPAQTIGYVSMQIAVQRRLLYKMNSCSLCIKSFHKYTSLRSHMPAQTIGYISMQVAVQRLLLKLNSCTICIKSFCRYNSLRSHMQAQTLEKRYAYHREGYA